MLGAVIATELSIVGINVMLNQWNNRFYNALQDRNWDTFVSELLFFCILAGAYILLAVYQLYLNQWLQIRWRQWMTKAYLGKWLDGANHYRMQLLGDAADNPDQRIAEDIQMFVDRTLTIGIGLLSAMVTLGSFVIILWTLSVAAPLHLFGSEWNIPGYLVWAALIYALIGTYLTHLIGWPLVGLNFNQQRFEADFRFNLVRVRENSEQIALLKGEPAETDRLVERFNRVVANWLLIMTRTKKLSFFTNAYSQASIVFPYVVVSPAYFAGKMQLGGLMQTASAFNSVQTALSFFINVYRSLAEWQSVIQRLDGFSLAVAGAQAAAHTPPVIDIEATGDGRSVELDNVAVNLPNGTPLVATDNVKMPRGEPVLLTGPSGAGKSTLFRAIAGIWPFGSGRVVVPKDARLMMLPQRPYFPVGPLAAAVSYPAEPGTMTSSASRRQSARWACQRWRSGSTRRAIGTGCFRSASSSASASPARCCRNQIPVSRRSHGVARRAFGGGAVSADPGAFAGCDRGIDRASLDACGVPPPWACARARRQPLQRARGSAEGGSGIGVTTSVSARCRFCLGRWRPVCARRRQTARAAMRRRRPGQSESSRTDR